MHIRNSCRWDWRWWLWWLTKLKKKREKRQKIMIGNLFFLLFGSFLRLLFFICLVYFMQILLNCMKSKMLQSLKSLAFVHFPFFLLNFKIFGTIQHFITYLLSFDKLISLHFFSLMMSDLFCYFIECLRLTKST